MAGEVNNQTAAATYTDACTATGYKANRVRVTVRNNAIWLQLGFGGRGGAFSFDGEPEVFVLPGTYSYDESQRPPDAARARAYNSAAPGLAPQVSISLVTGEQP